MAQQSYNLTLSSPFEFSAPFGVTTKDDLVVDVDGVDVTGDVTVDGVGPNSQSIVVSYPNRPTTGVLTITRTAQPLRVTDFAAAGFIEPAQLDAELDHQITVITDADAAITVVTDDHETRITQNESDIATNAADIATNAADIATNAADIATNAAKSLQDDSGEWDFESKQSKNVVAGDQDSVVPRSYVDAQLTGGGGAAIPVPADPADVGKLATAIPDSPPSGAVSFLDTIDLDVMKFDQTFQGIADQEMRGGHIHRRFFNTGNFPTANEWYRIAVITDDQTSPSGGGRGGGFLKVAVEGGQSPAELLFHISGDGALLAGPENYNITLIASSDQPSVVKDIRVVLDSGGDETFIDVFLSAGANMSFSAIRDFSSNDIFILDTVIENPSIAGSYTQELNDLDDLVHGISIRDQPDLWRVEKNDVSFRGKQVQRGAYGVSSVKSTGSLSPNTGTLLTFTRGVDFPANAIPITVTGGVASLTKEFRAISTPALGDVQIDVYNTHTGALTDGGVKFMYFDPDA